MTVDDRPASERIVEALQKSKTALSIDEICKAVFGRIDNRKRNVIYVNLHRLDEKGLIEKVPGSYRLKGAR